MNRLITLSLTLLFSIVITSPAICQDDYRTKVIIDNDFCGDPDGLIALAHQILCTEVEVRGIIGAHLKSNFAPVKGNPAKASVNNAVELLDIMGMKEQFPIVAGAERPMESSSSPVDSEGARLIIEEARTCTPDKPLFLLMGGPLTDAASALLTAPEIAPNMILVWIGGQEYSFGHQQPWMGVGEVEFNLNLCIPSAQYIFNDSNVRFWQVPRDAYRRCLYSYASWDRHIAPLGNMGKFLDKHLNNWRSKGLGQEVYCMGDSPLILLSSMQTFFDSDTASSDFVDTPAPHITAEGKYDFSNSGRNIRVYTILDTSLLFKDMEDRFFLFESGNIKSVDY